MHDLSLSWQKQTESTYGAIQPSDTAERGKGTPAELHPALEWPAVASWRCRARESLADRLAENYRPPTKDYARARTTLALQDRLFAEFRAIMPNMPQFNQAIRVRSETLYLDADWCALNIDLGRPNPQ